MIEGKTRTGFKFKVDERVGQDWRILSAISMAESSNPTEQVKGTTDLVKLILGNDEQKLIDHIAKKNEGFVPVAAVTNEIVDILTSTKTTKN